jgi:Carboxypeptidase activation peptide
MKKFQYRFLEFPGETGKKADLIVPPHKFGEFSEIVDKFELKSRMTIKNLQECVRTNDLIVFNRQCFQGY